MAIDPLWPIDTSQLDNPMWSALNGPHRQLAVRLGDLAWYPPSIAPFVAIPRTDSLPDLESAHGRGLATQAYFVGTCPKSLPDTWQVASSSSILQLFPSGDIPETGEDAGVVHRKSAACARTRTLPVEVMPAVSPAHS